MICKSDRAGRHCRHCRHFVVTAINTWFTVCFSKVKTVTTKTLFVTAENCCLQPCSARSDLQIRPSRPSGPSGELIEPTYIESHQMKQKKKETMNDLDHKFELKVREQKIVSHFLVVRVFFCTFALVYEAN